MKRILIMSVAYAPFMGGAEVAVKEITDHLSQKGFVFDMVTLNLDGTQAKQEQVGSIHVYRVGGKGRIHKLLFPFIGYFKARSLHKKNNYDAIWSIMASFNAFAALFFKYNYPKVPFILNLQEGDPIEYIKRQVRFVYPLFKSIFTHADVIQAISYYLVAFAKDMGARVPVKMIPNGVDIQTFGREVSDSEIELASKEMGKEKGDRMIITTSRLVPKNAVGDIVSALQFLPTSVKLTVIGTGPLESVLRKQVEELKLGTRVLFLGYKYYQDLPRYLKASDVFVRPSLSEGMGISFIEAMAAGIPIIATPVGGIPDFLHDGETGLFANVKNPKSIAIQVMKILDNPELRQKIVTNAHHLVVKNYDWKLVAERMRTEVFTL